ncbi:MAG TPA: oxidoreductase [Pseudonocardia sp.]|nr:oxidoreductase [Pseudonocardia sp.]
MGVSTDPLAPLLLLPGVSEAVEKARDAIVAAHNHPFNRRGWPTTSAEASVRAARASAVLQGGNAEVPEDGLVNDPVLAGALRVSEQLGRLLTVWQRAPLQALARLHVLAATDLVDDPDRDSVLGRPRGGPEVSARLELLAQLVGEHSATRSTVAAPVLVAVVHGELLALAPFAHANGIVARAAARLTAVSTGLDPKALAVPEVGHLRRSGEYRDAAAGFGGGEPDGLARWLVHCCAAWEVGGKEAVGIANSLA